MYRQLKWSFLGQIGISIHCIYLYHTGILYPIKKKIKKAFCNTVAVQQPLTLGYMYSVYTSIKLGMFHSSFYTMKVNINFFFIYFNSVKKIYHSYVCKKRKPENNINVLLPEPFLTLTICVMFHLDPWKLMRMRET